MKSCAFKIIITLFLVTGTLSRTLLAVDENKIIAGCAKIVQGYSGYQVYNGLKFMRRNIQDDVGGITMHHIFKMVSDCFTRLPNNLMTINGMHKLAKGYLFDDNYDSMFTWYKLLVKITKISAGIGSLYYFINHTEYNNRAAYLLGSTFFTLNALCNNNISRNKIILPTLFFVIKKFDSSLEKLLIKYPIFTS